MKAKSNYKASEHEIMDTVNDFTSICCYVEKNTTILSKRLEMLGKNDLFELNKLLHFKKEVVAPNYQQESYPYIDLMFNLAIKGKLYQKTADAKGNVFLKSTDRKLEYDSLNNFEKYSFLLETFWTQFDFKEMLRWGTDQMDQMVKVLSKSSSNQKLQKGSFSKRKDFDVMFSYNSVFLYYFSFFGFCTVEPIVFEPKKFSKYNDNIKEVIPTKLGVNICGILAKQKVTEWNIPWLEMYGYRTWKDDEDGDESDVAIIPLFKHFEPIFNEGVLSNTVSAETKRFVKGSYIFKVSLAKNIWRKIKVSFNLSLADLHLAIQEAFDFDNDHLYSFFMDNKRYSRHAYHSEYCEEGPFADEAIIGELGMYASQKILYLFDYGDSWEFEIQLMEIKEDGISSENYEILEKKGEAPEQYHSYDDFEDDFED